MLKIPGIKIIDQALLRELGLTFGLSLAVMTLALFIQQMLRFSDVFLETGIPFSLFLRFLLYVLPFFLVLTIPIAALMASLLTFSRMNTDREYTAIQAAGVSPYRLVRPVFLFALLAAVTGLWISIYVQPWSGTSLKNKFYETLKKQRNFGLQEGVFNTLFNRVIYIQRISPPFSLQGLLISDQASASQSMNGSDSEKRVVTAQSGVILIDPSTSAIFLQLRHGGIHRFSKQAYQVIRFSTYTVKLGVDDPIQRGSGFIKDQWTMSLSQFRDYLDHLKNQVEKEAQYRNALLEYHRKFSLPMSAIVFGLMGVPIGAMIRTSSRMAGFGLGILIILFYYLLFIVSEFLNRTGALPPLASAWLPNAVTGLFMIWLIWKMGRK